MRNVITVIKHEVKTMLGKPSFWITTFLLPAAIIVLSFGSQVLAQDTMNQTDSSALLSDGPSTANLPLGYVDLAGLIKDIPDEAPAGLDWEVVRLRAYADEAAARAALDDGKISKYYLVERDYLTTGDLTVIDSRFSIFNSLDNNDFFEYVLRLNLTNDAQLARALMAPTANLGEVGIAPTVAGNAPQDDVGQFGVPFAAMFIFFFVLTMTSGYMLQSVSKEKENRTIEVLLVSLRPRDLMLGKILGLGVVALLQVGIWAGGGLLVLNRVAVNQLSTLTPEFIIWGLLYFVLGYLLYAAILGGIGALAPSAREGAQFTFIVMLPLMIVLWAANSLIDAPHGTVAVVLSLFPLTSPTSMITRLASASIPFEQLALGLVLLAAATYLIIVISSKFFRADTLLSMDSLNLKRLARELRR